MPGCVLEQPFTLSLLFLILLHSKYVIQQPLEDLSVAVNTNVNLVLIADLLKTLFEVLHVFYKQSARKSEVALVLFTVVNHMNHYRVLELGSIK